ncbi:MAG: hypothetical protein NVSMB38_24570 [Ktedonobacteraceae bacterium]
MQVFHSVVELLEILGHRVTVTVLMGGTLEANSECPPRMHNLPLLFQTSTREALNDLALKKEERDKRR